MSEVIFVSFVAAGLAALKYAGLITQDTLVLGCLLALICQRLGYILEKMK